MNSNDQHKVLIIQENGHHPRNRDYRECFALKRAIESWKVHADIWGKGHGNFTKAFEKIVNEYDAVISLENYDAGWHPDLSSVKIPKVFWCIDAHMGVDRYIAFVKKNRFDIVFNSTMKFVEAFNGITGESIWLPNAYDSFLIDKLPEVGKTISLGFCGNVVNRGEWIDYLKKRYGLHHDQMVIGPDMVRAVNSYHLHWNMNVSIDINYRNFETLGCCTLLLTNYVPYLECLFKEDEHILVYRNKRELDEKLAHYLSDEKAREAIAHSGHLHVRKHHRYVNRARDILEKCGLLPDDRVVESCSAIHLAAQRLIVPAGKRPGPDNDALAAASGMTQPAIQSRGDLLKSLPITIVTETLNYVSGGVRCIVEVLNRLAGRGYRVFCHVTHPDLRCEWLNVDFPILPIADLASFKGIAISPYSPTADIVAKSNAIGKFYWVHSYEPKFPELTGRSDQWRIMSENSYRFERVHYFTVSTYVKMILELIYGRQVLSPLVPGGVDTHLFKPGPKNEGTLKIMFLSREHRFRGAHDIVQALNFVQEAGIDIRVAVMGMRIDMGDIAHDHFPPLPQDQFAALLGQMDIFIHASHFEGLPLPPLEAMACGCAVVATPIGASDYLLDGFNALVVPPKRSDKIAAAVLRLADDEELRARLQRQGIQTVIGNYTWDHTADRLLEALEEGMAREPSHRIAGALVRSPSRAAATVALPPNSDRSRAGRSFYRVSAIVSTHNAETFIRGCLEDLEAQTIADQLEIIVVDSGSRQNEVKIVQEFQESYDNIVYLRTERRETVYQAWNRAIKIAKGCYITNANTDDRHRQDALEVMANVLDALPEIALVYADVIITERENETFDACTPSGYYNWRDYDRRYLLEGKCFIGPQPMWRKTVHEEYGYFDESFVTSGDFEFWLRISQSNRFLHLPVRLGLYLNSPGSIEHRNRRVQQEENCRIVNLYRQAERNAKIVRRCSGKSDIFLASDSVNKPKTADAEGNMIEDLIQKVHHHRQRGEYDNAVALLTRTIASRPEAMVLYDQLCDILIESEQFDEALAILKKSRSGNWDLRGMELCASALERAGRYTEAANVLARAFSKGFRSACLLDLKGCISYQNGDLADAIDCFKAAIALDDDYGPAYTNYGLLSIANNAASDGLALIEKGFARTPCDLHVLTAYHSVISESGHYARAESLFSQALKENPEHKELNYLYIDILIQQHNYDAAMDGIEFAMASFGVHDGILGPALDIRKKIETSKNNAVSPDCCLSLCMIVKNEQENLAQALFSVKGLVDETIVVDTGSGDKTREIARIFGATVYDFPWNDNFADARNAAVSKASGEWILILDADERISTLDHDMVKQVVSNTKNSRTAYSFTTRNYVDDVGVEGWQANQGQYDEEVGTGWYPSIKVRLFPNDPAIQFENAVHEKVESSLERAGIAVSPIDVPIHHFGDLDTDHMKRKKRMYFHLGQHKLESRSGQPEAIIEHAIQAGEIRDFQKAIALWSKVLTLHPDYAKAWFNLGYAHIQLNQYQKARKASKKALELDPNLKEATLNLSLCELRVGDIGKSIKLLKDFLSRFPDHPMATGNLGIAYCLAGQKKKAIGCLNKVAWMGFDGCEFVSQHIRDFKAGGKSERATALQTILSAKAFGKAPICMATE